MPYTSLKMAPGIDVEKTPLLNSAGFSESVAIRFFEGLPQKIGGWAHLNSTLLTGVATGLHAWADLAANAYIAVGTDQRLELFFGGLIYDITPLRATTNAAPDFSTVISTPTVTVTDIGNDVSVRDWINIPIPVAVGGIVLQGFYLVQSVIDANNYTITSAANAASTVNNTGAVPNFTTTISLASVTVTLINHGIPASSLFYVQVTTTVGGITIAAGAYNVTSVTDANNFVIQPGPAASSSASAYENAGNSQIEYLIASGLQSSAYVSTSGGYGVGGYGVGAYGVSASGTALTPLRQWFLDNFGQDLVGNYNRSPIYLWVPTPEPGNIAIPIDTTNFPLATSPPQEVTVSFVAAPKQMIIALGCDDAVSHVFDPNLVRWCDVGDFTDWLATSTNQAGSFRIPSGSRLVGGISAPNFIVIWTDIDMWLMTYLGGTGLAELVWGFNQIAGGVDLLAARGVGVYRNLVFWVSSNGFFMFDGNTIRSLQCPVWDKFWFNLNRQQIDKVTCQVNSWFQEISWAFPSASENGNVDSRITYNVSQGMWMYSGDGPWTYDDAPTLTARTAWIDDNVYGPPIGTDQSGYLQQHEIGYDADGFALPSSVRTGWFSVQEGTLQAFMERLSVDLKIMGGNTTVQITVFTQDWPIGPVRTYGPYTWNPTSGPPWSIVRARGRFASIQIASVDLGVWWRLGDLRYLVSQAGRR